jgi:hypothetical protein
MRRTEKHQLFSHLRPLCPINISCKDGVTGLTKGVAFFHDAEDAEGGSHQQDTVRKDNGGKGQEDAAARVSASNSSCS